jgi:hypothetical protein
MKRRLAGPKGPALLIALCVGASACSDKGPPNTAEKLFVTPSWQQTTDGPGGCNQRQLQSEVGAILGMYVDHRLARLDVTQPGIATEAGVVVGDSVVSVRERYGEKVWTSPHKYTYEAGGQYLTVQIPGDHRLVFETDGKVVTRYRVGRTPEVEWVEGCA